ncbi:MAG: hypothetical protein AMXMBFR23_26990 [Chloroflexota bacterium]
MSQSQETRALREQTPEALQQELEQAHQALFNLRFQSSTRQLADNSQIAKTRKRIARIKTLLAQGQAASGK